MFSGLTIWYWVANWCALPRGRLFLLLAALLKLPVSSVSMSIGVCLLLKGRWDLGDWS